MHFGYEVRGRSGLSVHFGYEVRVPQPHQLWAQVMLASVAWPDRLGWK